MMAIDWNRFTFLCNVGDHENVWVYPTDNVAVDLGDMAVTFRRAQDRRLLPKHNFVPANFGHKPGIAVFFSRQLKNSMPNIGATIERIAGTVIEEGMNPTVAPKGKP